MDSQDYYEPVTHVLSQTTVIDCDDAYLILSVDTSLAEFGDD